jgi:AP-1-like transcription factor
VLESSATSLATDNQRLKLALQRAKTENEILRASTASSAARLPRTYSPTPLAEADYHDGADDNNNGDTADGGGGGGGATHGVAYSAYRRGSDVTVNGGGKSSSKSDGGVTLLTSAATWDYIVEHPLVKSGQVDIADVCERLKRAALCDGGGPVFAEKEVRRAVEVSRRGGGDELI